MSASHAPDLAGRTAVVTGATSGIGRAIAGALAARGVHVAVSGRDPATLEEVAKEVASLGGGATPLVADAREVAATGALAEKAAEATGRLDVYVANAGLSHPGTLADGDPEAWREMLEVNVLGLLAGVQGAVRTMRRLDTPGHVVLISSIAGRNETAGVYGATKAAVNLLASTLRKELEDDPIRVVNVLPGAVMTNFARHFDPAVIQGLTKAMGVEVDFRPGEKLPDEAIEQIQARAKPFLAHPDDIARAVVYAVSQPPELDVFQIEVRPAKGLPL
ncbi:MAG: SDR family oxidoreductase [Myxococcota bacterium]|nr:SDR family oxidoreductase [Myxococcota bacterium]